MDWLKRAPQGFTGLEPPRNRNRGNTYSEIMKETTTTTHDPYIFFIFFFIVSMLFMREWLLHTNMSILIIYAHK